MKIHTDKKAYQRHCKEQALTGRINDEAGDWKPASTLKTTDMIRHFRGGNRVTNRPKQSKCKTGRRIK